MSDHPVTAAVGLCVGLVILAAQPVNGQGLDRGTAEGLGNAPNALTACVLGGVGATACPAQQGSGPPHAIRLEWKPPPLGGVSHYEVYRYRVVTGNALRDMASRVALCGTATAPSCGASSTTSFVDGEQRPQGGGFVYFVIAAFEDSTRSGPSNLAAVTID